MNTKILQVLTLASGLMLLSACGGSSKKSTPDTNTTVPDATSITHNGTTYGFVTSPYTGKVWLDKNLGAAEICAGFDDAQCYGDYYQWGRNYDGHQESNLGTTITQASNVTTVGHSLFIEADATNDFDWAKNADASGSRRTLNWSATDGSSVCPVGFRVPNITELRAETLDNGVTNRDTAFSNFLKLPSAGYRDGFDGSMDDVGSWGVVWASSVDSSGSLLVYFSSGSASGDSSYRASGFSVRCLRD